MVLPNVRASSIPNYTEPSLPALPPHLQSDTHLTAHLASRFHVSLPTAKLSSQALICINNYTSSAKGPDGGKEGSAMGEAEDLAQRAWTRLGAQAENQAVVFLGESGSGKTTVRAHLLSSFLSFSSTPLSTKISLAAFVFDSLTTTKSVTTPTASKAGLFLELQYDATAPSPTLIGGKLLDHRLERSRIAAVPTGERSFHVLYYLLAGTSASEKAHLGLNDPGIVAEGGVSKRSSGTVGHKRWRYLGHPTQLKVGINDAEGFQHFKIALRKLEFPRGEVAEICQILACILHIGQLEFTSSHYTTPTADESGGYSHDGGEEVTVVKNKEVLANVAAFLGLGASELEASLGYKTKTIHHERVTVMLDPNGARANADELAKTLYSLLVAYIIEQINQRTCAAEDAIAKTISIVDFPGFAQTPSTGSTLDQLLANSAAEMLYNQCLYNFFECRAHFLESEDVHIPATSYFDNSDAVKTLLKPSNGLLSILDDQSKRGKTDAEFLEAIRKRFQHKSNAIAVGSATKVVPGSNFASRNLNASFTVKHYAGEVDYPINGLPEENGAVISGDMMNLINSTRSDFVRELFGQDALQSVMHPREKSAVMQAQVSSKPSRMPSMARRKGDRAARSTSATKSDPLDAQGADPQDNDSVARRSRLGDANSRKAGLGHLDQGASAQFQASLENIKRVLSSADTNAYYVFCLKPNDRRIANQFDSKCVRSQLQVFGIVEISQRLRNADISLFMPFGKFLSLTQNESILVGNDGERVAAVIQDKQWSSCEALIGATGVFLSERCWTSIASLPQGSYTEERRPRYEYEDDGMLPPAGLYGKFADSETRLINSRDTSLSRRRDTKPGDQFDLRSDAGASALQSGDMFRNLQTREQMAEKGNTKDMIEVENLAVTGSRKRWLALVYLLTFYVPDFMVRWLGRMPRKDIRTAWREKLAINILIWLSCGAVIFMIIVFPQLICPKQYVYSPAELATYNGKGSAGSYVAIRGVVLDLAKFMPNHYPSIIPQSALKKYAGLDATGLFPVQVSAMCQGKNVGENLDPSITFDYTPVNLTGSVSVISAIDPNAQYHDFRSFTNDSRPDWFQEQMIMLRANYKLGYVGYSPDYVAQLGSQQQSIAILNGRIYDFTAYSKGGRRANPGVDTYFMDSTVADLFQNGAGTDVTKDWNNLPLSRELRSRMQLCLDNLFFVGALDTRNSVQCQFANYLLLAISILLCSVIGFKFFAALQFGSKFMPANLDKFVICQVPAYTEDEESLRRAIDSAARMKYDDKRKLLVVICDGMIIGQGNDRPTPRIVLDILGVSETVDPEPLSFESLGEGMKQHNMGKVYSGLYEVQGHIVPFLVVVKVGKPSEASRPGNRGKRDSQMVVMRFLNRVHYNLPMNPLELEMHHQIRNIIGVNPTFYEFMFQIDADTVVAPDSATRMVAAFLHDSRLIGICGETALSNAKSSYITMIQVYEYYISHNLTKAFESLFGSVTCLPGCFSMYRIRAAETGKPLFVSKEVVDAYANIRVDTLHMKNLLHLGEDRYLTTLLMKHHSKYKTKYTFHAHAWTVAPDSWKIFMSQRRRWINSTVHNLMELIPLQQLCGFCCFSMRFVVFVDLLSTIVQPVTVFYIGYLIVLIALNSSVIPLTAFILLGAIYGLQAVIFILRRKWEMIGWMILYILAVPVFSLGLPLYAFWHMDDFTWGNTRVVTGERGRQVVITDEGRFDPASIPRKKWEDYQAELWEQQSEVEDNQSEATGLSYGTKSFLPTQSDQAYTVSRHSHMEMPATASRLSLAPSEFLGAAAAAPSPTTPLAAATPGTEMELDDMAGLPDDDTILAEIRDILKTADLMTVTKKSIKAALEARFGMNMEWKKAYVGSATEAILSGQL